jgi:hypothetical protein
VNHFHEAGRFPEDSSFAAPWPMVARAKRFRLKSGFCSTGGLKQKPARQINPARSAILKK